MLELISILSGSFALLIAGSGLLGILGCLVFGGLTSWFMVGSVILLATGLALNSFSDKVRDIDYKLDSKKKSLEIAEQEEQWRKEKEAKRQRDLTIQNQFIEKMQMQGHAVEKVLLSLDVIIGISYEEKNVYIMPSGLAEGEHNVIQYCFDQIIDVEYVQNKEIHGEGGYVLRGANGVALGGESVKSIFTTTEHAVRIIVDDRDNPSIVARFEEGSEAEYAYGILRGIFIKK